MQIFECTLARILWGEHVLAAVSVAGNNSYGSETALNSENDIKCKHPEEDILLNQST